MASDSSAIVGTTAALHLNTVHVKIVHVVNNKQGVVHFALDSRPEILAYSASRSSVKVVGPITASFVGPASADAVLGATATIVPTDVNSWPTTVHQVAADSSSVNFAVSALSPVPIAVLRLSTTINSQLKPRPLFGRHPEVLVAWDVETTATTFRARFEFVVPIELDGVDWVAPSSW